MTNTEIILEFSIGIGIAAIVFLFVYAIDRTVNGKSINIFKRFNNDK